MSIAAAPSAQKIDIVASVRAAYTVVSRNARLAVALAWLPFALLVGTEIIASLLSGVDSFRRLLEGDEHEVAVPSVVKHIRVGAEKLNRMLDLAGEISIARGRVRQMLSVGEIDAGCNRGVGRGAQKQELGDPEPQYVMHSGRSGRQWRAEAIGDQHIDLAEPAQHGCDQQARESAVPPGQVAHRRIVVDRVVERPLAAENRGNQVERNFTRGWRLGHQGSATSAVGCPGG